MFAPRSAPPGSAPPVVAGAERVLDICIVAAFPLMMLH
jgi:hypothetical protein